MLKAAPHVLADEIISLTSTTTTMQVRGIQQNVVFGCEGSNEAGNSQRVNSSIGVFPQGNKP